jgi:hypothetical protein
VVPPPQYPHNPPLPQQFPERHHVLMDTPKDEDVYFQDSQ